MEVFRSPEPTCRHEEVNHALVSALREKLSQLASKEHPSILLQVNDEKFAWRPIPVELLNFSRSIGMPIAQVNGQRFCGPPQEFTGPAPPQGTEIFIGALPRDMNEQELLPVLLTAGRVYQLRLMMDFSGTNRGFCFVKYYTSTEASRAIMMLRDLEIRPGTKLGVFRSVDNSRLYLRGIPNRLSAEDVYTGMMGVSDGVVRVTLFIKEWGRGRDSAGNSALVQYDSHRTAAMARRHLIPGRLRMDGSRVMVEWAKPEQRMPFLYRD